MIKEAITFEQLVTKYEENDLELRQIPQSLVDEYGYACLANSLMFKEPKIPNFNLEIAEYIKNNQFSTLESLINYIKNLENDIDKLFAIFSFIAQYIEYDVELSKLDVIRRFTVEEIFTLKKAVCTGYTSFFEDMAKIVEIDKNRIDIKRYSNLSKSHNYDALNWPKEITSDHSSLLISIDGIQFVSEPTWSTKYTYQKGAISLNFEPNLFLIPLYKSFCDHYPIGESKNYIKSISFPFQHFFQAPKIMPFGIHLKTETNPFLKVTCNTGYLKDIYSCIGPVNSVGFDLLIQKGDNFYEIPNDGLTSYRIIQTKLPKHPERCRFETHILFQEVGLYQIIMYVNTVECLRFYVENTSKCSYSIPVQYNPFHQIKFIPIKPNLILSSAKYGATIRFAVSKKHSNILWEIIKLDNDDGFETNGKKIDSSYGKYVKLEIPFDNERYEILFIVTFPSNGRYCIQFYFEEENGKGSFQYYTKYFFDITNVQDEIKYETNPIYYMHKGKKFAPKNFFYDGNEIIVKPNQYLNLINERKQYVHIKTPSKDDEIYFELRKDSETIVWPKYFEKIGEFRQLNFTIPESFGEYHLHGWINGKHCIDLVYIYSGFKLREESEEEINLMKKLKEKVDQEDVIKINTIENVDKFKIDELNTSNDILFTETDELISCSSVIDEIFQKDNEMQIKENGLPKKEKEISKNEYERILKENEILKIENGLLKKENEIFKKEYEKVKKDDELLKKENEVFKKENGLLKKENEISKNEYERVKKDDEMLKKEIIRIKSKYLGIIRENSKLNKKYIDLENTISLNNINLKKNALKIENSGPFIQSINNEISPKKEIYTRSNQINNADTSLLNDTINPPINDTKDTPQINDQDNTSIEKIISTPISNSKINCSTIITSQNNSKTERQDNIKFELQSNPSNELQNNDKTTPIKISDNLLQSNIKTTPENSKYELTSNIKTTQIKNAKMTPKNNIKTCPINKNIISQIDITEMIQKLNAKTVLRNRITPQENMKTTQKRNYLETPHDKTKQQNNNFNKSPELVNESTCNHGSHPKRNEKYLSNNTPKANNIKESQINDEDSLRKSPNSNDKKVFQNNNIETSINETPNNSLNNGESTPFSNTILPSQNNDKVSPQNIKETSHMSSPQKTGKVEIHYQNNKVLDSQNTITNDIKEDQSINEKSSQSNEPANNIKKKSSNKQLKDKELASKNSKKVTSDKTKSSDNIKKTSSNKTTNKSKSNLVQTNNQKKNSTKKENSAILSNTKNDQLCKSKHTSVKISPRKNSTNILSDNTKSFTSKTASSENKKLTISNKSKSSQLQIQISNLIKKSLMNNSVYLNANSNLSSDNNKIDLLYPSKLTGTKSNKMTITTNDENH